MCIATPTFCYFRRSVLIKEHCSASPVVVLDFLQEVFEWQADVILSTRIHYYWSADSKHMDLRKQQDYGSRGKALRNDGMLSQVGGRLGVICYGLQFASGPSIVIKGRMHMPSLTPSSAQGSARSKLIIHRAGLFVSRKHFPRISEAGG